MASFTLSAGRIADPLNEGLCVRHVSTLGLMTCNSTDDPVEVLSRHEFVEFDQIPIIKTGRIVGVLERKAGISRPLDDSLLVSADEHLGEFIFTLKQQPYRLVVDGTTIRGIVTWSDLMKPPVLLHAYSLLAQLELLMNGAIRRKYADDDRWVKKLDVEEQRFINGRKRRLERENLLLPTIELADFAHKAKVIRRPWFTRRDFEGELAKLVKLRNAVAHVHNVVRSDADLHHFVEQIETAVAWTKILARRNRASSMQ
jgi:hypothetical protein